MFRKLVAIEPLNMPAGWEARGLSGCAGRMEAYPDIPFGNDEIIRRIGDADGVLLSTTGRIDREVIAACPDIRFIGMCCSLYSPESANVDILFAQERGIVVRGVLDYGDDGVAEYAVSELVRLLHGFGGAMWKEQPRELREIPVGIVGMGATGTLTAQALAYFGARIHYYSRTRKPELEEEGFVYLPLHALLGRVDILCTCLNKNVVLLGEEEFRVFGDGKILMNISIGPSHEVSALEKWLARPGNYALGDTVSALDPDGRLTALPNVFCTGKSSGLTLAAQQRLEQKVIGNIRSFFAGQKPEAANEKTETR